MKKYLATALLSINCFCVDAASAARLSLINITNATPAKVGMISDVGLKVSVALQGLSGWAWQLSNHSRSGDDGLTNHVNYIGKHGEFNTYFSEANVDSIGIGSYFLTIAAPPRDIKVNFTVLVQDVSNNNDVPVPAALWLFGSAVFGMHGLVRRKTRIVFTA